MLPFTADVLSASLQAYNRGLWPLHLLALLLALATIVLTFRPAPHGDRAVAALLAAAWIWVGIGWFYLHLATIDFAAPLYAAFFVLEGLLIAWAGLVRSPIAFRFRADLYGWTGLALALTAVAGYPLADGLTGPGWPSVRLVGLAPARPRPSPSPCCCWPSTARPCALPSFPCSGRWSPAPPAGSSASHRTRHCRSLASAGSP
jgi:Family of unknown function (DUF6064)